MKMKEILDIAKKMLRDELGSGFSSQKERKENLFPAVNSMLTLELLNSLEELKEIIKAKGVQEVEKEKEKIKAKAKK